MRSPQVSPDDVVAGNGAALSCGPSADAVAGNGGHVKLCPLRRRSRRKGDI